jgi:tRNA pseudouridine55 synthase
MNGILIIDKPSGVTSHDVVNRVRRLTRLRRIGHAGTLDPFATGVLVLMLGRATRLSQFLITDNKEYEAIFRLGLMTDTLDRTGRPVEWTATRDCMTLSAAEIRESFSKLTGEIEQLPPMYSAKKVEGRKLYELARKGLSVERRPVQVFIESFELLEEKIIFDHKNQTCDIKARVRCSSGTYIRALAEQLGELLGTGAHLAELRRTRSGRFSIEDSITIEDFKEILVTGEPERAIIPPDLALSDMPFVHLTNKEVELVRNGVAIGLPEAHFESEEHIRMRDEHNSLIAVGKFDPVTKKCHPRILLDAE